MISNRKEPNVGTLAEDKAKALKQAKLERKQNHVLTKKRQTKRDSNRNHYRHVLLVR